MTAWERLKQSLLNPNVNPLIFFVATYLVGISINLTSTILQDKLSKSSMTVMPFVFGIPGLMIFFFIAPRVARWLTGEDVNASAELHQARLHKGLIVLASPAPGIETAKKAINYHLSKLEKVWLICSQGTSPSSELDAYNLKRELEAQRLVKPGTIELVILSNAEFEDPEAVREAIEKIYEKITEHHLSEGDVIIDITGGRKTTTAGAFLAGLPKGRHLEVINPLETDQSGHGTKPDNPVGIDIEYTLKRGRSR
jgi:hypothetical protein